MDYDELKTLWGEQVSPTFEVEDAEICFAIERQSSVIQTTNRRLAFVTGFLASISLLWLGFWGWALVTKGWNGLKEADMLPPLFLISTPTIVAGISLYFLIGCAVRQAGDRSLLGYARRARNMKAWHVAFLRIAPIFLIVGEVFNAVSLILDPRFPLFMLTLDIVFVVIIIWLSRRTLRHRHLPQLRELESILASLEAKNG